MIDFMKHAKHAAVAAVLCLSAPVFSQAVPSSQNPATKQTPTQPARPSVNEQVTVTASRQALSLDAGASSVRVLSNEDLDRTPGFTLDDRLKQVAGFQLFRRTSSWVANPTSQGISLRGLGSTAASRTLVLSDQVPLNDAFGGWVHWNEVPRMALQQVDLMRGGASDLYGSSAIGGAINVTPEEAGPLRYGASIEGGGLNTTDGDGLLTLAKGPWSGLGAVTLFQTDGYKLTAPAARGPVDIPAFVHWQSGRTELRRRFTNELSGFLRGNLLNENRGNGTPLTTNATRLWRYSAGSDWNSADHGRAFLRLYGSEENYRQSFSTVLGGTARSSERVVRTQSVPSEERGYATQWARGFAGAPVTIAFGSDLRDIRATNIETPYSTTGVPQAQTNTRARQRDTGAYALGVWQPRHWTLQLSGRYDRFSIIDPRQISTPAVTLTGRGENVFSPRLGVVRDIGRGVSLTGSVFRAFRGATLNELYRTSTVGTTTTLANPDLRSEKATGFELGGNATLAHDVQIRASGFWTMVNRPITTVIQTQTATATTDKRFNAGQLRSRGMMLEARVHPIRPLVITGAYQLAVATVTRFDQQPQLVGKWAPQVPRHSFTLTTTAESKRIGRLNVVTYVSGRQYDDTLNTLKLGSYARFDVQAEREFARRFTASVAVQNLLDRSIDAGRTGVLTLAAPQTVTMRLAFHGAK
jgi:outer membrane receptor protein involved in Fe transport